MFFLMIVITLSGCYLERGIYVHRHPWSGTYRVHKYYYPKQHQKYRTPIRNW